MLLQRKLEVTVSGRCRGAGEVLRGLATGSDWWVAATGCPTTKCRLMYVYRQMAGGPEVPCTGDSAKRVFHWGLVGGA